MTPQWTPSQQQAIQLHGRDLLISAAAGSGKTATLTERIVRELTGRISSADGTPLPPADISRMLIVTFTRAAASELRSRISRAISAAIAEQPDNRHLYRQLVALGSADICTIDSFYLQPVRANFERLGLPSSFRLADDGELAPLRRETMQRLIDQHYTQHVSAQADPDTPLSVLQDNDFARAMDDLMPNRDRGENVEVLLKLYEQLLAFPAGMELLRTSAERLAEQCTLPFCQSDAGRVLTDELCRTLHSLERRYQAAIAVFRADEVATKCYLPSALSDMETVQHALLCLEAGDWDGAGETLRSFSPLRLGSPGKKPLSPEAVTCKQERTACVAEIRALAAYFTDDDATRRAHMKATARTMQRLYELLCDYDRAIRELKLHRGIQDFTDVRRAMLSLLLDDTGAPTDVARALQEKYDAVYIDEYQDVDTVQDTIFSIIGCRGNRFMVGDIKQSIYAFRGAEPSIFADYRRRFAPIAPGEQPNDSRGVCLSMSENFRCNREIIEFTNAVCGYLFETCADSLSYRREDELICRKTDTPAHPVQLLLLERCSASREREDEEDVIAPSSEDDAPVASLRPEAVAIAAEIHRLIREETLDNGAPIRPADVAVLMRSLRHADEITAALAAYGIESSHRAASSLATHPDMTDLVNLLCVIDNPRDDVPLTSLLSAAASPVRFEELVLMRTALPECAAIPVFDVLCMAAEGALPPERVDDSLCDRCRRLVAFVRHWQALARSLTVDRLLRRLYGEPGLRDKASSPVYLTLYEHARRYRSASFCGLYSFLRYFRRLLSDPRALSATASGEQEGNCVTILTIHKSKGLEFPVVFVADCATATESRDRNAPVIFDASLGAAARIFCPEDASRAESCVRHAIAARLHERNAEEEMRILYVAMTRARERLYLTAQLRGSAEHLLAKVNRPSRADRAMILSAKSHLEWILAAIAPANRSPALSDCYRVTVTDQASYAALPSLTAPASPAAPPPDPTEDDAAARALPGTAAFYRAVLREHSRYRDPNALLRTLPTKAAASKLTRELWDAHLAPAALDAEEQTPVDVPAPEQKHVDEAQLIRHRIELMRRAREPFSALLHQRGQASAARRGTATHLFLQYCDHRHLAECGVDAEIRRLQQGGYLSAQTVSLLHRGQLNAFAHSTLLREILAAKRIRRELQFNRFLPYRTLTSRPELAAQLGDASLYVQGSLDLLLEHADGTLTLVDYKTDRLRCDSWGSELPPAQRESAIRRQLLSDHAEQLRVYADAVEGMFARRPDRVLIYSLPLQRSVDLTDAILPPSPRTDDA